MIILAGTPIGNDADASPRLREALEQADLIAAEDTRRLLNLAGRLGLDVHAPVVAYHDHNEAEKAPELVERARAGEQVVVVSDAGMPAISDPGYRLVALAARSGVAVTALPGPSAVVTGIALSGLPSDRFTFEGFLPRKKGERAARIKELSSEVRTMVFYESPRRLAATLIEMSAAFGEQRRGAVTRELTKTHEEVRRGELGDLAQWAQTRDVLGEIVIVVEGCRRCDSSGKHGSGVSQRLVEEVRELHCAGLRLKAAAGHVAKREGVSANELYQASVQAANV